MYTQLQPQTSPQRQPQAQQVFTDAYSFYMSNDSMNDGTPRGIRAGDKIICSPIKKAEFLRMLTSEPKRFVCETAEGRRFIGYVTKSAEKGVIYFKKANPAYKAEWAKLHALKSFFVVSPLYRNGNRKQVNYMPAIKGAMQWIAGEGWGGVHYC